MGEKGEEKELTGIYVPKFLDHRYYYSFMIIFLDCMKAGYSTVDARNYSELTLRKQNFSDE